MTSIANITVMTCAENYPKYVIHNTSDRVLQNEWHIKRTITARHYADHKYLIIAVKTSQVILSNPMFYIDVIRKTD